LALSFRASEWPVRSATVVYEVVGLLGRGGTAVVELAVDDQGRQVAMKRLDLTGSARQIDQARRRLRREAEILRSLQHPAIVAVLDVIDDGAETVIVLPALAENLEDRVARLGPLPAVELARVGRCLLDALAAAHRCGVVHRDVKPANVLFDAAGSPALADFGVATTSQVTAGLTEIGAVIGTPTWIPPEQARGEPASPAGDVFGLAATLVWAGTGQTPYEPGPPSSVLLSAAAGRIRPLPATLPDLLSSTLARMLEADPALRPSAARVLGGFGDTAVGLPPAPFDGVARPARPVRPVGAGIDDPSDGAGPTGSLAAPARRRRRVALGVAATALACVLAGAATIGALSGRDVHARRSPRDAPGAVSAAACIPEPYLPCGAKSPAPHTDGWACDPGWYNLDGSRADGCEAHDDYVAGTVLRTGTPVRANLVPLSRVDTFATEVRGSAWDLCWGALRVTLTAPVHTAEALAVRRGVDVVARAVSVDGEPASATVPKPSCFGGDPERLTVEVSVVAASGDSSARDFTLTRNAGW
jgi:tRNA A-37 threonylcarbamoyl transferase component Bud32